MSSFVATLKHFEIQQQKVCKRLPASRITRRVLLSFHLSCRNGVGQAAAVQAVVNCISRALGQASMAWQSLQSICCALAGVDTEVQVDEWHDDLIFAFGQESGCPFEVCYVSFHLNSLARKLFIADPCLVSPTNCSCQHMQPLNPWTVCSIASQNPYLEYFLEPVSSTLRLTFRMPLV
jgi:hypothetical protein